MAAKGKRGKSPTASAAAGNKWDANITTAVFNEESWNASIGMIIANQLEDFDLISILAEAVATGSRRRFTAITKDDLFKLANDLGNPKVKKGKDVPANFEVCEAVKPYLDAGSDVPLGLVAKLIKFKMLSIKAEDLKKIEAEKKAKPEAGGKGKKGAAADKGAKERGKSPKKGGAGGGKKSPEPPSVKTDSKLRKRGEEDPDAKYIDDEPDDGATRYFIVTGFKHPHLLPFMAEVGIAPDAVVKYRAQSYDRLSRALDPTSNVLSADGTIEEKIPEAVDEEKKAVEEKERKALNQFWRDITLILRGNSRLGDVAMLDYEVKSLLLPDDLTDAEKKGSLGTSLFEDTACLLYDLLDLKRQWKNYITNLHLLKVPGVSGGASAVWGQLGGGMEGAGSPRSVAASEPGAGLEDASGGVETLPPTDLRYYRDIMDSIPMETTSVELMMHAMLEQVEATEQGKTPPSEVQDPKRADGVDAKVAGHFANLTFKLALSDEEMTTLEAEFPPPTARPDFSKTSPDLIHPLDSVSQRMYQLDQGPPSLDDPKAAELAMLQRMRPYSDLIRLPPVSPALARQRAARLQEMIYFCSGGGLKQEDVDRAFKQFVFENVDLTSTDLNGIVLHSRSEGVEPPPIAWDDPYPFFRGLVELFESEERQWATDDEYHRGGDGELSMERGGSESRSHSSPPDSRPTSAGILKRSRSVSPASPGLRKVSNVHFTEPAIEKSERDSPPRSPPPQASNEEAMYNVAAGQRRQLDEWCFAEHLEPHVLLQVLRNATHALPYMDTYYHKRDHSLFVVLHNPHHTEVLSNHAQWQKWLHANVGFRNYLEQVAEAISDWTREQEAMYQAELLRKEVEKTMKDDEHASRPTETPSKKPARGKTPPKKGAKGKQDSRPSSAEQSDSEDILIRAGSLKAMKLEQDRIQKEKDEEERKKAEKRSKSAEKKGKGKEKEDATHDKGKRPGSKGKGRGSRSPSADAADKTVKEADHVEEDKPDEPFWPFTGYDLGDNLAHVSGEITHMFPTDGGTIRTERTDIVQGSTTMRTSVLKDGHVFTVHVTDPVREVVGALMKSPEQAGDSAGLGESIGGESCLEGASEQEGRQKSADREASTKPEPVSFFGSFTAHFSDSLSLSLSAYGPVGEPEGLSRPQPEPYVIPPPTAQAAPALEAPSPKSARRKSSKGKGSPGPPASPSHAHPPADAVPTVAVDTDSKAGDGGQMSGRSSQRSRSSSVVRDETFQNVTMTTPDGQQLLVMLESQLGIVDCDTRDRRLLLKMSYPGKSGAKHVKGRKTAFEEVHRLVTMDGIVVKVLKDGSTMLLYPDGSVAECKVQSEVLSPRTRAKAPAETDKPLTKKKSKSGKQKAAVDEPTESDTNFQPDQGPQPPQTWLVTQPNGERYWTNNKPVPEPLDQSQEDPATDSAQTMSEPPPKITPADPIPVTIASDPSTGQVLYTRADRVMMVHWAEAEVCITEHPDGTRVTQFVLYQEMPSNVDAETGEEGGRNVDAQQFVRIECPGYASVLINQTTGEVETRLGGGSRSSVLVSSPSGQHMVQHCDGGQLCIHADGTVLYTGALPKETAYLQPSGPPTYLMRHHGQIVCEVVDADGNMFTVDPSGNCHVMLSGQPGEEEGSISTAPDQMDSQGRPSTETSSSVPGLVKYGEHAPRLFIIHADGSGTELLRYRDIADFLTGVESQADTAVVKEELQDCPNMSGITVLRPFTQSLSEQWLVPYLQDSIVPAGLHSRDLKTLPPTEYKKPGPPLGTNMGRGLTVGSQPEQEQSTAPVLTCPKMLEFRQFIQSRPVTEEDRSMLKARLREYAEYVQARLANDQSLQVRDPRSAEERFEAAQLLARSAASRANFPLKDDVSKVYENSTAPAPPAIPPTPQKKRNAADWDRDRREKEEEKRNREALRKRDIPSYFRSEFGKDFLLSQVPDIHYLAKKLDVFPPSNPATPVPTRGADDMPDADQMKTAPPKPNEQKAVGRPTEHSYKASHLASPYLRGQGPVLIGPSATKKPVFAYYDPNISDEAVQETSNKTLKPSSLHMTVTGKHRQTPVLLPSYLHAGRPNRIANERQAHIEDPARRPILSTAIVGGPLTGQLHLRRVRGLDVLPQRLDFGLVREGYTYRRCVLLKNTGVETSRFKIRSPPPATGIRLFYKPGPIAAGLSKEIYVEVYAIAVGVSGGSGVGLVEHDLEITSETDTFWMPIVVRVMTASDYDQQTALQLAAGVELVARGPVAKDGIVRPRKDVEVVAA